MADLKSEMKSLTFTLIQTNLFWEDKRANLDMLQEKIESIQEKTEVVVLPEMFSTGFTMNTEKFAETMEGPTVEWMKKMAAKEKIILTGSMIVKAKQERSVGNDVFNRLIWMLPNGQYGFYDKRHLFAFTGEDKHYTAGNKRLIASVKGWKINLQVCYDLRFPVWARQASPLRSGERGLGGEVEYDVLIYVANWPQRRNLAWKTLLQARAIENLCYVIGVNCVGNDGNNIYHSGNSMIVDPLGEILYHKAHDEDVFTMTLEKEKLECVRKKYPFWKDADDFRIF